MREKSKERCYLIPVGGDSLEFIKIRGTRKPTKAQQDVWRKLYREVAALAKEPKRRK